MISGLNKRRYKAGTESEARQIFNESFIAAKGGHACVRTLQVAPYKKSNSHDDSLFVDLENNFFQVVAMLPNNQVRVRRILKEKFMPKWSMRNWDFAGIYSVRKIEKETRVMCVTQVAAKAVYLHDNIIAIATTDMIDC